MYGECYAEKWVLAENKGAIAEIATNRCGTASGNMALIEEMTRNIFEERVLHLGDAFVNAKRRIIEDHSDDIHYVGPAILYTLLGDPALSLKFFETPTTPEESGGNIPNVYLLGQNCPNPFNSTTTIRFSLSGRDGRSETGGRIIPIHTILGIYNVLGQEVRTLLDDPHEPGYYTVSWDGKDNKGKEVSSGIYLYWIKAGDFVQAKRMLLLK